MDYGRPTSQTSDFMGWLYNIIHGDTELAFALLVKTWKNPKDKNVYLKSRLDEAGFDHLLNQLEQASSHNEKTDLIKAFFIQMLQGLNLELPGEIKEIALTQTDIDKMGDDIVVERKRNPEGKITASRPEPPMAPVDFKMERLYSAYAKFEEELAAHTTNEQVDEAIQRFEAVFGEYRLFRAKTQAEGVLIKEVLHPILQKMGKDLLKTLLRHGYHYREYEDVGGNMIPVV